MFGMFSIKKSKLVSLELITKRCVTLVCLLTSNALLCVVSKHVIKSCKEPIGSISLTLCAETEAFHLEQCFVARPKQIWRAFEFLVYVPVKTHERTLKHTSLWLGRKTFSGTNQMPERLRPFGTNLVRQYPWGLFYCPSLSEDDSSENHKKIINWGKLRISCFLILCVAIWAR